MTSAVRTPTPAVQEISAAGDGLPLTIAAAAAGLRDGSYTAVGLLRTVQARADRLDAAFGTYLARSDDAALAAATTADEELAAGIDRGPLHGIPLGVKDIIATDDAPSTAQSLILRPEFGQQGDAVVVARLRAAGAVITGKASTMEYAIGTPDPSKGFPTPRNPFDPRYWTGGSSSGTGNGVLAGMFLGGLGTDTGGSVRLPAAWCGISGMKQTFGLVPKSGCVPLGVSRDHIGPMARSARDCAAMLAVMAGPDESDACSVDVPVPDYVGALTGDLSGLRIGVDYSFVEHPNCDPAVGDAFHRAVEIFLRAGAVLKTVTLPLWDELVAAMRAGMAEAFNYHRPDMRQRWTDYGRPTRRTVGIGIFATAADVVQASRVRRVGVRAVAEVFSDVDLVLMPTATVAAPLVDGLVFEKILPNLLTSYWNAVGNPAISIPMGCNAAGLPIGLQLAGRPFGETTVFRAADAFQQLTDHHLLESPLVMEMLA